MAKHSHKNRGAQSRHDANVRKAKSRASHAKLFGSWQRTLRRNRLAERKQMQLNPLEGAALSLAAMEHLIATPAERARDRLLEGVR